MLGNGFGGFIAVALAARHGAKFDRLVIVDSLAAFPVAAKEPLRILADSVAKQGMSGALDIAIRRMFPEPFIAAHPEIVAERKRALEQADPACFRAACQALIEVDLAPVLGSIRNTTLVMAGSEDATTPPAPGRFSTVTGCPSTALNRSATGRAMVSVAEPGVNGTMMRIGLDGNGCASAALVDSSSRASNDFMLDFMSVSSQP